MPNASNVQTSFLGGEWSPYVEARTDSERYKSALSRSLNGHPQEEGIWTRRTGMKWLGHTKVGGPAVLRPFDLSADEQYEIEFGEEYARFFVNGERLLAEGVDLQFISEDTPAVVVAPDHGLVTGDTVIFIFTGDDNILNSLPLRNREFLVTVMDADQFTIVDEQTGAAVDGSTIDYQGEGQVFKIIELETAFEDDTFQDIRIAQGEEKLVLLEGTIPPQVLTIDDATPAIDAIDFLDGPYMDENTTTTTLTPSGTTGSITLTASSTTGINDGQGFLSTDVGRLIRILWQPAPAVIGQPASPGDTFRDAFRRAYYVSVFALAAILLQPKDDLVNFTEAIDPTIWTWGVITAVTDTTHVTFTIEGPDLTTDDPQDIWRFGLYSDTTGYPTCGVFYDGRLWLAGAQPNRIDASKSNDPFNFAPTTFDSVVADDNAIAAVANAEDRHTALWLKSDDNGLLLGTAGGEWRGRVSAADDPISPTNFQLRRVTKNKVANAEATLAHKFLLFIQRMTKKVLEFGQGDNGYEAPDLSVTSHHLTESGLEEIVYQREPLPMIWARRSDGTVIGALYRHDPAQTYAAWHEVEFGEDRTVESIAIGASFLGTEEALYIVSREGTGYRSIEMMTPMFTKSREDWQADYVDMGVTPTGALQFEDTDITYIRFYGLWPLEGKTVALVVGGLDVGDFLVGNGYITVPITGDDAVLTPEFLATLTDDYGEFSVTIVEEA